MFNPPRCPFPPCPAFNNPAKFEGGFYARNGFYTAKCRPHPIPRFKCLACGKGFSRQTFRLDYCDKKPYLNAPLFRNLSSGVGLRQSGRTLGLSRRCTELKARKISRHLGHLNRNLTDTLPANCRITLDEMETFEGERAVLPVSVPVLVETQSMYVISTDVAAIKPSGTMTEERRQAIQRAENKHGKREDDSVKALSRVFKRLKACCGEETSFTFVSDKKTAYARLLRDFFGPGIEHKRISSKRKRDQTNPLRFINLTNAMARDLNGRLRRESWLVSKQRKFLRLQLHVFAAFRNFIRRRVNRRPGTPAQMLGFLPRPARFEELLSWRQDWGLTSIHPIANQAASIAEHRARGVAT